MKEQIIKEISLEKTIIRVFRGDDGRERAEIVFIDAAENEYVVEHDVYVHGEYHDVLEKIIATKPTP